MIDEVKGEYNSAELGYDNQLVVGITPSSEMKHVPANPRNNSGVMQLSVFDIKATFKQIEQYSGAVLFGPSYEEENKFYY